MNPRFVYLMLYKTAFSNNLYCICMLPPMNTTKQKQKQKQKINIYKNHVEKNRTNGQDYPTNLIQALPDR